MGDLVSEGFVVSDSIQFGEPRGGYIAIEGEIHCLGGVTITVDKRLKILRGRGATAIVRNAEYSYNAHLEGRHDLFRYCSPHAAPHGDGHGLHHHVHRFNDRGEEVPVEVIRYSDDIPHVSEVVDEARELWYSRD